MPCTNCSATTNRSGWVEAKCVIRKPFASCSNCRASTDRRALKCAFDGVTVDSQSGLPSQEVAQPSKKTRFRVASGPTTPPMPPGTETERRHGWKKHFSLPFSSGSSKRLASRSPPSPPGDIKRMRYDPSRTYGSYPSGSQSTSHLPNPAQGQQTFPGARLPLPPTFPSQTGGYPSTRQHFQTSPASPRSSNHRSLGSGTGVNWFSGNHGGRQAPRTEPNERTWPDNVSSKAASTQPSLSGWTYPQSPTPSEPNLSGWRYSPSPFPQSLRASPSQMAPVSKPKKRSCQRCKRWFLLLVPTIKAKVHLALEDPQGMEAPHTTLDLPQMQPLRLVFSKFGESTGSILIT
ncbi:hypothetical protein DL96DRAFT_1789189 [Flagelloscypha sp. PMI_526]|nr:hypothetical protein DL96DRAFT_1789189 [Flagelloscypha sp. PMI_526]